LQDAQSYAQKLIEQAKTISVDTTPVDSKAQEFESQFTESLDKMQQYQEVMS
jgi:hypothetical protein